MKYKEILLILPNAPGLEDQIAYPPLGLLSLASNMAAEWRPKLVVMQGNDLDNYDYKYFGISVHSVGVYKEVKKLIEKIHKNAPDAVVFVGGSAACMLKATNEYPNIYPILGEGEKFFGDVDTSDLDNIKFPARHLLPENQIVHTGRVHHSSEPSTTIIATRGCVYSCNFCDRKTLGKKFRKRSANNIVREIQQLIVDYGVRWFRFIDDCITLDKMWFDNLCSNFIGLNIKWTCLSRADTLTMSLLRTMKQAGCREIFFGFESGSQKMLDLMNKQTTVAKNATVIKMCKDVGIKCCGYFMFGFPGEDDKTVDETIAFLDKTKPDKSRISTFVPIPGTDVWERPQNYNVRIKDNYEDFWYFDDKDFGLEYDYLKDDTKIHKLRDRISKYYDKNYRKKWVK